jgi:hypothetical protein
MPYSHPGLTLTQQLSRYGVTGLLICSAGLNVLLSRELRATRPEPPRAVEPGTVARPLTGQLLDGTDVTVSFVNELPTVLYYFSAECGWCERNWANVAALRAQTRGRYRVVGVAATASIPPYMEPLSSSMVIVTGVNKDTRDAYRFHATPSTVLVGADGRIRTSWRGAWQSKSATSLSTLFAVTLPGLSPPSSEQ